MRAPAELGGRSCEYIHSIFQSHLLLCELLASSHSRFVDSGVFSSGLTQRGMAVCPLPPPLLHLSSRCSPKPSPGVRACIPCGSSIRMNGASRWRCNGWWPDFIQFFSYPPMTDGDADPRNRCASDGGAGLGHRGWRAQHTSVYGFSQYSRWWRQLLVCTNLISFIS